MSRMNGRRRMTIALAATLVIGVLSAGPASAFPLPVGSSMRCAYTAAGYHPTGLNPDISGWQYDGRLTSQICVVLANGKRFAKVQLSAPNTMEQYDRVSGAFHVYLDACFGGGRTIENLGHWYHDTYHSQSDLWDHATLTWDSRTGTNRWFFPSIAGASTSGAATCGYRVRITTYSASVIGHGITSVPLALSSTGLSGGATFNSGWLYI